MDRLRKMRLRVWNGEHRMFQVSSEYFSLLELLESPDFKPQPLRSIDLSRTSGRSHDSGRCNALLQVLGEDCSGPIALSVGLKEDCNCVDCRQELAHRSYQHAVEVSKSIENLRVGPARNERQN